MNQLIIHLHRTAQALILADPPIERKINKRIQFELNMRRKKKKYELNELRRVDL